MTYNTRLVVYLEGMRKAQRRYTHSHVCKANGTMLYTTRNGHRIETLSPHATYSAMNCHKLIQILLITFFKYKSV